MKDRFNFRLWDKLTNCYRYGLNVTDYLRGMVNRERYILEQCTGLKDKNGKLIYEGDIVKSLFYNNKRKTKMKNCVVKWCDGEASFVLSADTTDDYRSYECSCKNVFEDCEIVGNIHENPELLEKEDD